jgi:hypothetical protein
VPAEGLCHRAILPLTPFLPARWFWFDGRLIQHRGETEDVAVCRLVDDHFLLVFSMYRNWAGGGLDENIREIHSYPNLSADPWTRNVFATQQSDSESQAIAVWYCPQRHGLA